MYPKSLLVLLCLYITIQSSVAQSTFSDVHRILQTRCSGSSCHGGSTPTFNVNLSETAMYTALVNANPVNPAAAAKGDKLISPGYVDRSFLLRKLSHGLNTPLSITQPDEGNYMPSGAGMIPMEEFELIRQWILAGAQQTGVVVDTSIINRYYREGGIDDAYPVTAAPAPGTGFQIYIGKIFIKPGREEYISLKHKPRISGNTEIPKIVSMLPASTHHFVMYKFQPGGEVDYRDGMRDTSESSHSSVLDGIGLGPGMWQYELPAGTAYLWEGTTALDLDFHVLNPSTDSILATEWYVNVYTQPVGTADHFMLIRNFPVLTISIPQDGQVHSFTEVAVDSNETKMWKIWQMYSHTHRYGVDYDIYRRNPDGSQGNQEYEGWYSYEQGFNVGYYRYGVDVTFKYYPGDSLLEIDPRVGFIHTAKFKNTNGPDPVNWGLTSQEEMMVLGFQYIYGDDLPPLSVKENTAPELKLNVFPNPAFDKLSLNYVLREKADVRAELVNLMGEKMMVVEQKQKEIGNYVEEIMLEGKFSPGIYFLNFYAGNGMVSKKVVIE